MNPALQYQIFNPATQQFVQIDGGQDSTSALLFNLLMQQYVTNHYLRCIVLGQTLPDTTGDVIGQVLAEPSLFKLG